MTITSLHFQEISGPRRRRGQIHGEALRRPIRERDRIWRERLTAAAGMPAERFIDSFLQRTRFTAAIERWTPGLLEEVRGISEGARLPYPAVLAAQFMDEEWWLLEGPEAPHHCSSLGMRPDGDGATVIGQTMDLPCWMDGFQTLLLIRDAAPGIDSYVVTVAGMIGLMGLNSRGLGVCVNTLLDLAHSADGLPVAFVSRGLLERANLAAAAGFLRAVPHASGQNYIIGDPENLADFECSAGAVAAFMPDFAGRRVWHANHPLACQDLAAGSSPGRRNSEVRQQTLDWRMPGAAATAADARRILSSRDDLEHPVSRPMQPGEQPAGGFFTFAAMVAELAGDPVLQLAPGVPCSQPFASYRFDRNRATFAAGTAA